MMTVKVKPSSFGPHHFSEVFQRGAGSVRIPFITIKSVAEWLGEDWSVDRCMAVLASEPWIVEAFSSNDGAGRLGVSPFGVAMIVVLGGDSVSVESKVRAADLLNAWVTRRSESGKALAKYSK